MTVIRWIEEGRLEAFRTAGGHRRIPRSELERFCGANGIPFDEGRLEDTAHLLVISEDDGLLAQIERIGAERAVSWQVHRAATGFETGQVVATQHPRLVIVDARTRAIDGLSVLTQLSSMDGGGQTTTALLTLDPPSRAVQLAAGSPTLLGLPPDSDAIASLMAKAEATPRRRRRQTRPRVAVSAPGNAPRVLIVDGGVQALDELPEALETQGPARVDYARSLNEGLLRAGRNAPELMLIGAPRDEDALLEICRQVKSFEPTSSVRLVVVFDEPRPDMARRLMDQGVSRCIEGRVNAAELARELAASAQA